MKRSVVVSFWLGRLVQHPSKELTAWRLALMAVAGRAGGSPTY